MPPHPGEVWLADLGLAAKTRPVVVVSRDDPDPPRALILYVPLTTQHRQSPYEVVLPRLPFLEQHSVANVQGLDSLPTVRLERRLGTLPDATVVQNPALPERILFSRVGGGDTAPETLTPAGTTESGKARAIFDARGPVLWCITGDCDDRISILCDYSDSAHDT
jgi:mRNA interferase MazF